MISIIVPVYNESSIIHDCLLSIAGWQRQGHEVIVVDGGSRDETREIADRHADLVCQSPRGRAMQMNVGASRAHGEILMFLHADTRLPEPTGNLEQQLSRPGWGRFDVRLSGKRLAFRIIEYFINMRSRLSGIATGDQAIFVSKQLFTEAGGFPGIPLMEDIALCRKLLNMNGRPLCLKEKVITSSRRWEKNGIARTVLLMWSLRTAYWLGAKPSRLARFYAG